MSAAVPVPAGMSHPLADPSVHSAVPRGRSLSPTLPSNAWPGKYPKPMACVTFGHCAIGRVWATGRSWYVDSGEEANEWQGAR